MMNRLFIACMLGLLVAGNGFHVHNAGSARRRRERRRAMYELEEKWRVNTCSLAQMVNSDIKIGQCPRIINKYQQIYSISSLGDYYKRNCDIIVFRNSSAVKNWFTALFRIIFLLVFSFTSIFCATLIAMEIIKRMVRRIVFPLKA